MNPKVWNLITDALIRVNPPTENDKEICQQIRQRPIPAQIPNVLFPDNNDNKRRRGLKRSVMGSSRFVAGHRKRSKNDFHQEQDTCSATTCLKPYS